MLGLTPNLLVKRKPKQGWAASRYIVVIHLTWINASPSDAIDRGAFQDVATKHIKNLRLFDLEPRIIWDCLSEKPHIDHNPAIHVKFHEFAVVV